MSWVYAAYTAGAIAVSAASQYFGGKAQQQNAYANAQNTWNTALWNAQNVRDTGMFNATLVGNAGRTNAMQQMMVAQLNVNDLKQVAEFNMDLQKQVTEYNVSLMLDEIPQILAARDLQLMHIRQEGARKEGSIVAYQAASGTTIGTGSNLDVLIDSRTQMKIDEQVVALQAHWNVQGIYDAIAKSEWEGQMAIDKLAFDTNMQMRDIKNQATLNAFATLSNSTMEVFSIMNNTYHNMQSIYIEGGARAASIQSGGDAAYQAGLIGAGGSVLSGALKYGASQYRPTSTPTATQTVSLPGGYSQDVQEPIFEEYGMSGGQSDTNSLLTGAYSGTA